MFLTRLSLRIGGSDKNLKLESKSEMNLIKIKNLKFKINTGMSFIEILVAIGVFSILGVLTTRAIVLTLNGGRKTELLIKVRENISYSFSVIERQLRNANSITSACNGTAATSVSYKDDNDVSSTFSCPVIGTNGYIASGSAQLTATSISITSCSFTCIPGTNGNPVSVKISVTGKDKTTNDSTNSIVTSTTSVTLRNY